MRKKYLPIVAAFFALPWLSMPAHADAVIGEPAPALIATKLDGKTFDLAKEHGKVVLVNFWATWCAPCRAEMPALDGAYKSYHAKGLDIIGLSIDRDRNRDKVSDVMHDYGYPAAMADDADTDDFGNPTALPVTYVIDRDGVVRARLTPDQTPLTPAAIAKVVQPLLAQAPGTSKH